MTHQLSDDLKPHVRQIAREMAAAGEVSRELPFGERGRLWIASKRDNLLIVLEEIEVEGIIFYVGAKVE